MSKKLRIVTDQEIINRVMNKLCEENYDTVLIAPFVDVIVIETLETLIELGMVVEVDDEEEAE